MAYYCLVRNNVGCFIRNIICRRNGYAKQDCFGYKSRHDCIQIMNCYRAFVVNQKGTAIALIGCLLIILLLMWATYIWSWNYTVKALSIGFE